MLAADLHRWLTDEKRRIHSLRCISDFQYHKTVSTRSDSDPPWDKKSVGAGRCDRVEEHLAATVHLETQYESLLLCPLVLYQKFSPRHHLSEERVYRTQYPVDECQLQRRMHF